MPENRSLACDCLELAFGITIVCVAMPFVAAQLVIEKVKTYRDLLKQMEFTP